MFRLMLTTCMAAATFCIQATPPAANPGGKAFASPDEAVRALVSAARNDDVNAVIEILGPSSWEIVTTRDPVADRKIRREFVARAGQKIKIVPYHAKPNEKMILAGLDEWPLPIPLIQINNQWYFDTPQAKEEILNRRVGSNELDAIEICRGYVEAQTAYASHHRTESGVPIYARTVISSPGQHDGLYWEGEPGSEESPIGKFIAKAFAEGYKQRGAPYHGYHFRILTAQGPHASGGETSYLQDDLMTKGFAMIAWPSDYGSTGIMTFLVSKTGIVYQKDLGPQTGAVASGYSAYNPDDTWTPVGEMSRR